MPTSNQKIVRIHNEVEKATLSKAQKKFNDLMNKIEVQKKLLQEYIIRFKLNQNQFDALLSFVYNTGSIRAGSDLDQQLRRREYSNAVQTLKKYVYSGGQILAGLIKRRNYEAALFSLLPGQRFLFPL